MMKSLRLIALGMVALAAPALPALAYSTTIEDPKKPPVEQPPTKVPEIDVTSGVGAMIVIGAGLLLYRERRRVG